MHETRTWKRHEICEQHGEADPKAVSRMGEGRMADVDQVESQRLHVPWMEEIQTRGRMGVALREPHLRHVSVQSRGPIVSQLQIFSQICIK